MNTKVFAECMKRNMDKQGITTKVLSEMVGVPVHRLKELETGEVIPKAKEIIAIGKAIKVPPLILMKGGGMVHSLCVDENGKRYGKWEEY